MAAVLLCVVMAKEPKDAAKVTAATADTAAAAATDNSAEAPQTRAVGPKTQRRAPAAGANFNKHESTHPSTNQNHNFACFTITKGAEAGAGWRANTAENTAVVSARLLLPLPVSPRLLVSSLRRCRRWYFLLNHHLRHG